MRFLFAWSRAVGRERAARIAGRVHPHLRRSSQREPAREGEPRRRLSREEPRRSAPRSSTASGTTSRARRSSTPFSRTWSTASTRTGPSEGAGRGGRPRACLRAPRQRQAGDPVRRPSRQLRADPGARREARPAGHRPLPAAGQPAHRRRDRDAGGAATSASMVVSGPGAALEVADALKKGRHIGVLIDQRIGERPGAPLLRPAVADATRSSACMARIFNCPVHGGYAPCACRTAASGW